MRRRWLVIVAALLVAGSVGYWLSLQILPYGGAPRQERDQRAPQQVAKIVVELSGSQVATLQVATTGRANFDQLRPAVGNIDFNQNMLVQVFTANPGRIIATFANVGDRVQKGQILFTVDSPDLLTAESSLIQAAAVLILQTRNLKRLTETLTGGGGAQKDVDQATSDQQTAEGSLRASRDAVRIFGKTEEEIDQIIKARKADPALVVRSPIAGLVTQRTAAPGLFVQPGNAPAPFTVADTSTMWMLANVVEYDAPLLRVGQEVRVRVGAYPDREFAGAITVLGAQVDANTRRLMVRSEIKDTAGLLNAGMFANFTIRVGEPIASLAVPSNAVVREGDGSNSVWVTADRRHFEKRMVRSGLQQRGMTQILEGLQPGELVVTDGAIFISNRAVIAGVSE
jgi:cobalt-zinc-cadmium efflux system membrane fusion protein